MVITMDIDHTTPSGSSVLDEFGLDSEFVIKSKLAIRIAKTVQELALGQRDAAARMGISQAKLSQLTRGQFKGISESKLAKCLTLLGHDITITISPRHSGAGSRLVVAD